jgi:hypothetical protein
MPPPPLIPTLSPIEIPSPEVGALLRSTKLLAHCFFALNQSHNNT